MEKYVCQLSLRIQGCPLPAFTCTPIAFSLSFTAFPPVGDRGCLPLLKDMFALVFLVLVALNNSQEKEENDSFLLQISIVNILGRRLVG
jgi:hypothetical protein